MPSCSGGRTEDNVEPLHPRHAIDEVKIYSCGFVSTTDNQVYRVRVSSYQGIQRSLRGCVQHGKPWPNSKTYRPDLCIRRELVVDAVDSEEQALQACELLQREAEQSSTVVGYGSRQFRILIEGTCNTMD